MVTSISFAKSSVTITSAAPVSTIAPVFLPAISISTMASGALTIIGASALQPSMTGSSGLPTNDR